MSQFFYIHPENPQARLINQAVDIVRKGGVIVYPTDSGYALGCKIEDKGAMERICRIRNLPNGHNFTLMCRDLSELSTYSFVDNVAFRLIKIIRRVITPLSLRAPKRSRAVCCRISVKPSVCAYRQIRLPRCCWKRSASRCFPPR
ncbi:YciO family [Klebsiella oxytoca]|nr:YciO family [Klebsiella oxytoca]